MISEPALRLKAIINANAGVDSRSQVGKTASRRDSAEPATARSGGKPLDPAPLPSSDTPHDIAIAQLESMADTGRTDAMRMLADRLRDCHFADHGSDGEIRQHSIDEILRDEQRMNKGGQFANEAGWVESRTAQLIAIRDGCTRVDADEAAHWVDWLDRAASAGDTAAMIAYAEQALVDPRARPDAWSADAVAQRKARAADYLRQALERGNCNAMMDLERAYDGDSGAGIFDPDPAMAYAFAWARWDWYRENHPDSDPESTESWLKYLANAEAKVAEDRRGAAQRNGDAFYARYCRGRPET